MNERSHPRHWKHYFIRRRERTTTTWTFRLGLLTVVTIALWLTRGSWSPAIARSLVCDEEVSRSDALLVENFDPDYLPFERAASLRKAGVADRVLVPASAWGNAGEPNGVALGTVDLMAGIARLGSYEIVPIPEIEPISLNAAYRIREFLTREHIRSVTVVAPLFRSRRSAMIYGATFGPAGIAVRCVPVRGTRSTNDWMQTWHGIEDVAEQWLKLQYYRLYVMPFVYRRNAVPAS